MSTKKKVFFKYSEEDMERALNDVRNSICTIREAERRYNVPHSTLINKIKGTTPDIRKMGPKTILTTQEENLLEKWIIANAKKGIPLNKNSLFETVSDIIKSDKRPNPFKDDYPGDKWFRSFLKRHPTISRRHAESINTARAQVTEQAIREWHEEIRQHLEELDCLDILKDPCRIINSDESGYETNPKTGIVLGPKGMKNFYQVTSGSEKEQITVLFTISASGEIYPPMIVYPYERIPAEIVRHTPPNWIIGRSKSGWMTGQSFHSYVCNTFILLLKEKNVKFPILYLVDGHRSHLTYHVSKFCSENGIILFALYPNATHILQPADVALFKPLKQNWKHTVYEWKRANNNKNVTKPVFSSLLEKAIAGVSAETVKNGFRKCGLYPFDPNAIDFAKCMSDNSRKVDNEETQVKVKPTDFKIEHLLYLESAMPPGRTVQFRQTLSEKNGIWNGDVEAKELFYVWRKLRQRFMTAEHEERVNIREVEEQGTEQEKKTEIDINENEKTEQNVTNSNVIKKNKTEGHVPHINNSPKTNNSGEKTVELNDQTEANNNVLRNKENEKKETESANSVSEKVGQNCTPNKINIIQNITLGPPSVAPLRPISSSFLDHVYWPEESPEKFERKRKTERLPYATTSTRWLKFYEDKENKKRSEEELKKQRALERKRKKDEKESNVQNNKRSKVLKKNVKKQDLLSSDEDDQAEWNESGTSGEDLSDEWDESVPEKGDFLVVAFPGKKKVHNYVCIVQKVIHKDEIEVQALSPNEDSTIFKIIDNDISIIDKSQIVNRLSPPEIIASGERFKYKFSFAVL